MEKMCFAGENAWVHLRLIEEGRQQQTAHRSTADNILTAPDNCYTQLLQGLKRNV